ncbi:unnamed protein product [Effrenium voratum]|nr:unnamed protein product [Effrenium voratum]
MAQTKLWKEMDAEPFCLALERHVEDQNLPETEERVSVRCHKLLRKLGIAMRLGWEWELLDGDERSDAEDFREVLQRLLSIGPQKQARYRHIKAGDRFGAANVMRQSEGNGTMPSAEEYSTAVAAQASTVWHRKAMELASTALKDAGVERLLDIGSSFNPLQREFETVTAVDAVPAHESVLKADFLEVDVREDITEVLAEDKSLLAVPAEYYDGALLAMVLRALSPLAGGAHKPLRREMLRRAALCLRPGGLLVVIERSPLRNMVGAAFQDEFWTKSRLRLQKTLHTLRGTKVYLLERLPGVVESEQKASVQISVVEGATGSTACQCEVEPLNQSPSSGAEEYVQAVPPHGESQPGGYRGRSGQSSPEAMPEEENCVEAEPEETEEPKAEPKPAEPKVLSAPEVPVHSLDLMQARSQDSDAEPQAAEPASDEALEVRLNRKVSKERAAASGSQTETQTETQTQVQIPAQTETQADSAIVEIERPWLLEPCLVHAQLRCLHSVGLVQGDFSASRPRLLRRDGDSMKGPDTQGVLRSLDVPGPARARAAPAPAGRPERSLRALAAARQMATTAALRAVRRAANDAADEAVLGRRRRPSAAEAAWEALLALLPAARHATRAEIRKNESCAICHGKLFKTSQEVRTLPCGHTFHDACILPWLSKKATCPLDRTNFKELVKSSARGSASRGPELVE